MLKLCLNGRRAAETRETGFDDRLRVISTLSILTTSSEVRTSERSYTSQAFNVYFVQGENDNLSLSVLSGPAISNLVTCAFEQTDHMSTQPRVNKKITSLRFAVWYERSVARRWYHGLASGGRRGVIR